MPKKQPRVSFELLDVNNGVKTWHIEAIHVTITGNKRKYTEDELKLGARSLSFRPLNINHDESLWLPYNPFKVHDETDNRTLALSFVPKDRGVVGKIQIADEDVNAMIERGDINRLSIEQVSVEGEDCGCSMLEGCFCEQNGVTFTGIALLTSNVAPGDPETKISAESVDEINSMLEKLKAKFKGERKAKIERAPARKKEGCGCRKEQEAECPEGQHMVDNKCVPMEEATIDQITADVVADMVKKIQAQYDLVKALEQKLALDPGNQYLADELYNAKWALFSMVMDHMKLAKGERKESVKIDEARIKENFIRDVAREAEKLLAGG